MRSRGRTLLRGVSGGVGARAGELAWIEIAGHRIEDIAAVVARPGSGATGDPTPEPRAPKPFSVVGSCVVVDGTIFPKLIFVDGPSSFDCSEPSGL